MVQYPPFFTRAVDYSQLMLRLTQNALIAIKKRNPDLNINRTFLQLSSAIVTTHEVVT